MTAEVRREIVIEFERIQLIRKRAKTYFQLCADCGQHVDFVPICQAAEIFGLDTDTLLRFIRINRCHFQSGEAAKALLCLNTFIAAIKNRPKLLNTASESP